MLYKGVIRFLKLAEAAIAQGRVEDRFNALLKASRIITGLQGSLDFGSTDEISKMAHTLHRYYTGINVRILSLNFDREPQQSIQQCKVLIDEIQQMCDVWDNIDHTMAEQDSTTLSTAAAQALPHADASAAGTSENNTTFSA